MRRLCQVSSDAVSSQGKFLIDVLKRYDNVMPREMLHDEKVKSTDTGKMALRAAAAHQNGLEVDSLRLFP